MIKGKSIESPLEMLRESKGISQTELAIRVGCSQNLISKYERSGEIPGKQYIAQIGKALDISVVDLVALYNKNLLEFYGVEDLSNATSLDGTKFPYNMINEMNKISTQDEPVHIVDANRLVSVMKSELSDREYNMLALRFNTNISLEEIGELYGVTRERVRQIIHKSLHKLDIRKFRAMYMMVNMEEVEQLNDRIVNLSKELVKYIARVKELGDQVDTADQVDIIEVVRIPLDTIGLSRRSYNCLRRSNISSIDELSSYTRESLLKIRNMGAKSVNEICDIAKKYNIYIEDY